MEKWEFESKRIYFRKMNYDDTNAVLSWRNKNTVRKYFFYQSIITPEEHLEYFHNKIETGKTIQFIMMDKYTLTEFGCIYFSNIDNERHTAESGIFIGEEKYCNCGFGTEALKRIIEYGFEKLRFSRIDIRIKTDNIRSIQSHMKAGFVENRDLFKVYEYEGNEEDVVFMSIYPSGDIK